MSCTEEGKRISQQKISNPNYNINQLRNPEYVINEQLGSSGEITLPQVFSPKKQFESCIRNRTPEKQCVTNVLKELVKAEEIARRQYDELLMFPELKSHERDIIGIRNDEQEHEDILECIIRRVSYATTVSQKQPIQPQQAQPDIYLNRQKLREIYGTIIDRFSQQEKEGIAQYEKLLANINEGLNHTSEEDGAKITLMQLCRKINRILQEKRSHLDVINAVRDMISGR